MTQALDDLVKTLTLEQTDLLCFSGLGSKNDGSLSTFGGHFLGQATAAACATIESDFLIHSLHGYFLSGGVPGQPIVYEVENLRDGRKFCSRQVIASQAGKEKFRLTASFTGPESGKIFDAISPSKFDQLPEPESIKPYHELMADQDPLPLPKEWALREHGIDVRVVHAPWVDAGLSKDMGICMWIKANGNAPVDPRLHSSMLAYQSDESIADNILLPFGLTWGSPDVFFVSLDHALWFHQQIDLNQWHFVEQAPVVAANGRGLTTAKVWSQEKQLVASFTQEVLMREL
jgi:acyl-CoA thioesterase II